MNRYTIVLPELELAANAVIEVTNDSPRKLQQAAFKIAEYAKREIGFDFVPFSVDDDEQFVAYLFTDHGDYAAKLRAVAVFGACCFRYRKYTNAPAAWALQWVWLHPYFRNKKHLSEAWRQFKDRFGVFYVEPPFSPAMKHFLQQRKDDLPPLLRDSSHLAD